jgi:tetratricopeptide (TPR) repeat protein
MIARESVIQEEGGLGDPYRAPSVHYLVNGFLRDVEAAGLTSENTISEIEERVIRGKGARNSCPRDGRIGSAFVDAILGEDNMGRATHMLSYTWGYTVADIVDALNSYCQKSGLDPKRTYVWICALCINQHRVHEKKGKSETVPFDTFAEEFGSRVRGIGHVLALMGPWRAPKYITRAWCIYELSVAMSIPSCKLEFLMPPHESVGFAKAVLDSDGGLDDLWQALNGVCIKKANASVASDKENIMRMVDEGPGLFRLNDLVRTELKLWFAEAAESEARRSLSCFRKCCNVDGMVRVVRLLSDMGLHDRALSLLLDAERKGQETFRAISKLQIARFHAAKGNALLKTGGDLASALASLQESDERFNGLARPLTCRVAVEHAEVIAKIGAVLHEQGDPVRALTNFSKAYRCLEIAGALESALGAGLLIDTGLAQLELRDFAGACRSYAEARKLRIVAGASESPTGVYLLHVPQMILSGLNECKQLTKLQDTLRSCAEILKYRVPFNEGPRYAYVLATQGYAQMHLSSLIMGPANFDDAKVSLEEAVRAYSAAGLLETPFAADAVEVLAYVRAQFHDRAGVRELCGVAERIRTAAGLGVECALLPPHELAGVERPSVKNDWLGLDTRNVVESVPHSGRCIPGFWNSISSEIHRPRGSSFFSRHSPWCIAAA